MVILAIDLGKAKSVFCWYEGADQSYTFKTVASTPQSFHDALAGRPPAAAAAAADVVVIEACDMAGWVHDLCRTLGLAVEVANANTEGWRWKRVKNKSDRRDALKLAQLRAGGGPLKAVCVPARPARHYKGLIFYRHRLVERRDAREERDPRAAGGGGPRGHGPGGVGAGVGGRVAGAGQADRGVRDEGRAVVGPPADGAGPVGLPRA
jgi:hypothetical protein